MSQLNSLTLFGPLNAPSITSQTSNLGFVNAQQATVGNLTVSSISSTAGGGAQITAQTGNFANVIVANLTCQNANLNNLSTQTGNVVSLYSQTGNIAYLTTLAITAQTGIISALAAQTGNVVSLSSQTGNISYLTSLTSNTTTITAQTGIISALAAQTGNVAALSSQTGNISFLTSQTGNISALSSQTANIAALNVGTITSGGGGQLFVNQIAAAAANISNIYANSAAFSQIVSAANVGVGCSPSSGFPLDVVGNARMSAVSYGNMAPYLRMSGQGGVASTTGLLMSPYDARPGGHSTSIVALDDSNYSASIVFSTAPTGSSSPVAERMRITSTGNVLISGGAFIINNAPLLAQTLTSQTGNIVSLSSQTGNISSLTSQTGNITALSAGTMVSTQSIGAQCVPASGFVLDANGPVQMRNLLYFNNQIQNQMICLWSNSSPSSAATDYYGFGINNTNLRYNVPATRNHTWWVNTLQMMNLNSLGLTLNTGLSMNFNTIYIGGSGDPSNTLSYDPVVNGLALIGSGGGRLMSYGGVTALYWSSTGLTAPTGNVVISGGALVVNNGPVLAQLVSSTNLVSQTANVVSLSAQSGAINLLTAQTSSLGNVIGPLTVSGDIIFTGNLKQTMFANTPGGGLPSYIFANVSAGNLVVTNQANINSLGASTIFCSNIFGYGTPVGISIAPTGSVGVANPNPQTALDVGGTTRAGNVILTSGGTNLQIGSANVSQISFGYSLGGYVHSIKSRHNGGSAQQNSIDFYPWQPSDGVTGSPNNLMYSLTATGLGICNNPSPQYTLDNNGTFHTGNAVVDTSIGAACQAVYRVSNVSYALSPQAVSLSGSAGSTTTYVQQDYNFPSQAGLYPGGRLVVNDANYATDWRWQTKAPGSQNNALVDRLTIAGATGCVGVNNPSPAFPLDVNGPTRISGQLYQSMPLVWLYKQTAPSATVSSGWIPTSKSMFTYYAAGSKNTADNLFTSDTQLSSASTNTINATLLMPYSGIWTLNWSVRYYTTGTENNNQFSPVASASYGETGGNSNNTRLGWVSTSAYNTTAPFSGYFAAGDTVALTSYSTATSQYLSNNFGPMLMATLAQRTA